MSKGGAEKDIKKKAINLLNKLSPLNRDEVDLKLHEFAREIINAKNNLKGKELDDELDKLFKRKIKEFMSLTPQQKPLGTDKIREILNKVMVSAYDYGKGLTTYMDWQGYEREKVITTAIKELSQLQLEKTQIRECNELDCKSNVNGICKLEKISNAHRCYNPAGKVW